MFASAATEIQRDSQRRPYETVTAPDQVPLYDLVSVKGPSGEPLDAYRDVRRRDTSEIVSVVSSRYQLVQHREVAQAVHAIGEEWGESIEPIGYGASRCQLRNTYRCTYLRPRNKGIFFSERNLPMIRVTVVLVTMTPVSRGNKSKVSSISAIDRADERSVFSILNDSFRSGSQTRILW